MKREEIIRLAREAQLAYGSDEMILPSVERFAALVSAAERNKLAAWMIQFGFATGHGDTTEALLEELDWQIAERVAAEREACAQVCEVNRYEGYVPPEDGAAVDYYNDASRECAVAIRARGASNE